jgi:cytoskeleton protein RodZ
MSDASPTVGAQLTHAREAQGLSVTDVANRLKLTPKQIDALENDQFDSLGPVFSRGFVRNYARLLQLDDVALLAAMQSPNSAAEDLTIRDEHITISHNLSQYWLKLIGAVIIVAIALTLGVYQWLRSAPAKTAAVPAPAIAALTPAPAIASQPATAEASPALSATPDVAVPTVSAPAPAPAGNATLNLRFAKDAWVDIDDANKKRVVSRLFHAGETAQFTGLPPFSAVIGNSANVSVSYNGKPVDLAAHTKVSVARLTIE